MMNFADALIEAIIEKRCPCVVGLDTLPEYCPGYADGVGEAMRGERAERAASAVLAYNKAIMDAVRDIVPAVKPQLAYYERLGRHGMGCYYDTVAYARSLGLLVIADAKRGDIGSTASAYAEAFFEGEAPADAMTVNPYLGKDAALPFLERCGSAGRGIFALVKTSNPSSADIQDLKLAGGGQVSAAVAKLVAGWGEPYVGRHGYSAVGAVVGATFPEQAKALRVALPRAILLVPGYGAQGGSAADAAAAFDASGLGAIVNASRSVLLAWKHARWGGRFGAHDFADAARAEALRMRAEINEAIGAAR